MMSRKLHDVSSFSNFNDINFPNYHLDWTVDFDTRTISGFIELDVNVSSSTCTEAILDTLKLNILSVKSSDGNPLQFTLKPSNPDLTWAGEALHIKADPVSQKFPPKIKIEYSTHPSASSTCWLTPAQTLGKKLPYLFTQGQATLNRSLFPCQDTPATKSTFTARISVKCTGISSPLHVLMSALLEKEEKTESQVFFHYKMRHPVPAYLVALAVGDLASKDINPRMRIWAEPALVSAAHIEFQGIVDKYLDSAEQIFGPYVWDRYDLLFMPPSFPFGGMENPLIVFLSSTLIAGDKSLTATAAHEIGHSWFGNLVTNSNWSYFWLNEGFTMYAERRLVAELYGEDLAELEAICGQKLLNEEIDTIGPQNQFTKLVPDLTGIDPEETYNQCPYEKGYAYLRYLRDQVGSVQEFDKFLRFYVEKFKFQSITPDDMIACFKEYFPHLSHLEKSFGDWMNTPGRPLIAPTFKKNAMQQQVDTALVTWRDHLTSPSPNLTATSLVSLLSNCHVTQMCGFLDSLLEAEWLTPDGATKLDETYKFSESPNVEIALRWSKIAITKKLHAQYPKIRELLHKTGKQKICLPLYRFLMKGDNFEKDFAKKLFEETRDNLFSGVAAHVHSIVNG